MALKILVLVIFRFLFLFILFFPLGASGQQKEGANWFFGGLAQTNIPGTHLDFNGQGPVTTPFNYDYNSGSGVATISDKNGQLLFFSSQGYVATRQVVNGKYQEMPNGNVLPNNILGTSAELISQSSADNQVYHIFIITGASTSSNHDLYAAQVDMRLNNGFGDVVPNSVQLLKKNVGYSMAAMVNANNRDTWLLSQSASGDSLQAYLISPNGIAAPVISVTSKKLDSQSRFKGSPNSGMLVASGAPSPPLAGPPRVEIFLFNRATGAVADLYTLTMPNAYQRGFSYAFSPNNSKLYVGTRTGMGHPSFIYQYDLAAGNVQQIQQSVSIINSFANIPQIMDMQLAINGKIYISRTDQNPFLSV
ncbi:MAG TPA: hypothetical protein VK927_09245, partial [Adhaeribacter sp.]|nr:hypothetical protein [Adhaeribacter sp.]